MAIREDATLQDLLTIGNFEDVKKHFLENGGPLEAFIVLALTALVDTANSTEAEVATLRQRLDDIERGYCELGESTSQPDEDDLCS